MQLIAAQAGPDHPVIAAIPVSSHLDDGTPDEYVCVVVAGHWPEGGPWFGTARLRGEAGQWTVTEHSDWSQPMTQTAAITEMIRLAGHERPSKKLSTALRIEKLMDQRDYGNDYGRKEARELARLTGEDVELPGVGSFDRPDWEGYEQERRK